MKPLQKIGEHLNLRHLVIHQLQKAAGSKTVRFRAAAHVLKTGAKESIFLGNLDHSYHKKSGPVYGVFAETHTAFRDHLSSYRKGQTSFYDFSVKAATLYKTILERTIAASGGFMVLCEYDNSVTQQELLLVLMLNNKEGFMVNEQQLTLDNVKNLDLSKVDIACLIDLTAWQEITSGKKTDRQTYLSFVQGLKKVSNYFMSFIDAHTQHTSSESTKRLINTLEAYAISEEWDRNTRIDIQNKVFAYCHECMDQKKEILLSGISALVNKQQPEHFQEFATDQTEQVSAIISGDRTKMKLLNTITYAEQGSKIAFDTQRLLDNLIVMDPNGDKLTIKHIPAALRDQILKVSND